MKLLRVGAAWRRESRPFWQPMGPRGTFPAHVRDIDGETLSPAGLAKIAAIDPMSLPVVGGSPRIGPCVVRPLNFICIGLNYADHAAETGRGDPAGADRVPESRSAPTMGQTTTW